MTDIEIGIGRLNWPRGERVGDRYGVVRLYADPNPGEDSVHHRLMDDLARTPMLLDKLPFGERGTLIAEVLVARDSYHIGDFFHGYYPETPEVGESIQLGEGELFTETDLDGPLVGVNPGEQLVYKRHFMDPVALYRAHDQTVRLLFRPS